MLVFEDLHWADGSSIDLLCEALRPGAVAPALFVLAARPHYPDTAGRAFEFVSRERTDGVAIALAALEAGESPR